jgi:hypothetical protein
MEKRIQGPPAALIGIDQPPIKEILRTASAAMN